MLHVIRILALASQCRTLREAAALLEAVERRAELAGLRHALEWCEAVGFLSVIRGVELASVRLTGKGAAFLRNAQGGADLLQAMPGAYLSQRRTHAAPRLTM